VRLIVPFGPGAGADIGARLLSERLPARWGGKPVRDREPPGGDGLVAIQSFLSANDRPHLPVHARRQFHSASVPVRKAALYQRRPGAGSRVSNTILGVGVPAAMNIGTVAEFVARAKAEPGKFNAASCPASPSSLSTIS